MLLPSVYLCGSLQWVSVWCCLPELQTFESLVTDSTYPCQGILYPSHQHPSVCTPANTTKFPTWTISLNCSISCCIVHTCVVYTSRQWRWHDNTNMYMYAVHAVHVHVRSTRSGWAPGSTCTCLQYKYIPAKIKCEGRGLIRMLLLFSMTTVTVCRWIGCTSTFHGAVPAIGCLEFTFIHVQYSHIRWRHHGNTSYPCINTCHI